LFVFVEIESSLSVKKDDGGSGGWVDQSRVGTEEIKEKERKSEIK
jgi:hypothetical protein